MTTENQTVSIAIDYMTTEQLVQLSQGIGHQIEKLREQRLHLRRKIDERLADSQRSSIEAEIARLQGQLNAVAPGRVESVSAKAPTKRANR